MEHSKNHPSIRVHAPPGGHSNNIFGTPQDEQSAANKKKNTQSDIFGTKTDNNANAAPAKPTRAAGNNIFGGESEESAPKGNTIAGQYKQSQMKSNIFGSDEPATTRNVSNKNQSNIFGVGDDDQAKRQGGIRQGLRDPNASRMGYNPINGESYNAAPKANEPEKQQETPAVETPSTESSTNNEQTPTTETENTQPPAPIAENGKTQSVETTNGNVQKQDPAEKPVHTSVRVFHPPGGRSNGPLW